VAFSAVTMLCRSAVLISVGAWHMNFDEEQSIVHWGIINCHYDQTLRAGSSGKPTNIVTVISQHATERHTSDIQWYIYCDNILWFFFVWVCVCTLMSQYLHTIEKLCDNWKALWHSDNVECMNCCSRVRLLNLWMWQLSSRTRTSFNNSYLSAQVNRLLYSPGAKVMFSYAVNFFNNERFIEH